MKKRNLVKSVAAVLASVMLAGVGNTAYASDIQDDGFSWTAAEEQAYEREVTTRSLEDLLTYYESIPDDVLEQGDLALQTWQNTHGYGMSPFRANFWGCAAAVAGALRWKAKRARLEGEARSRASARHREENVAAELGLLRDDKRDLTGLCERLRAQLEQERARSEALEAKLEQAMGEAGQARTALDQEQRISEERLNMVKTLTEALSKPLTEQTGTSHRKISENASKAPLNDLEGSELLEVWRRYVAQQDGRQGPFSSEPGPFIERKVLKTF